LARLAGRPFFNPVATKGPVAVLAGSTAWYASGFEHSPLIWKEAAMSYNVSGWGTIAGSTPGNPKVIPVIYWFNNGQDLGAQFAQGKPEGAKIDGSANGQLVSFNHQINLNVQTGQITYIFQLQNLTESDTSFMLCGGGLV
jgi:hypothetical protein